MYFVISSRFAQQETQVFGERWLAEGLGWGPAQEGAREGMEDDSLKAHPEVGYQGGGLH